MQSIQNIVEPDGKIPISNKLVVSQSVTPVASTLGPATTKIAIASNSVALFAKVVGTKNV